MNGGLVCDLRMEAHAEDIFLTDEDGGVFEAGEDFDLPANFFNFRCADESDFD